MIDEKIVEREMQLIRKQKFDYTMIAHKELGQILYERVKEEIPDAMIVRSGHVVYIAVGRIAKWVLQLHMRSIKKDAITKEVHDELVQYINSLCWKMEEEERRKKEKQEKKDKKRARKQR